MGVYTSQIRRPSRCPFCSQGNTANVEASGRRYISDSATRAKLSSAEPSNHIPWLKAVSSCRAGTCTVLMIPVTSVNCRSRYATPISRIRATNCCVSSDNCTLTVSVPQILLDILHKYLLYFLHCVPFVNRHFERIKGEKLYKMPKTCNSCVFPDHLKG